MYGAEIWTFRKVDHKYLECFEVRYCRRMEQVVWTDRLKKKSQEGKEHPTYNKMTEG